MNKIQIADTLTDILFYEEGITDTARALHEALEDFDYKNDLYLIYRIQEEQCSRIRNIIKGIGGEPQDEEGEAFTENP